MEVEIVCSVNKAGANFHLDLSITSRELSDCLFLFQLIMKVTSNSPS